MNDRAGGEKHRALAIGNFDGVHLGHQALLAKVVSFSRDRDLEPAVLTFDPHPTAVVAPDRVPREICSLPERIRLLRGTGISHVEVLPFTAELAQLTPEEFVKRVVVDALRAKAVFVGENFRFGHKKAGSCKTLQQLGLSYGYLTECLQPVLYRGEVASSTRVRRYIETGSIVRANRLLARPFSLSGKVVSGHGIGSKKTVPTLNLRPAPNQVLPPGVYVTQTREVSGSRKWQSITNVGTRPTFGGDNFTIETFILSSFEPPSPDEIAVDFLHFVRAERQFFGPEELRAQILRDVGVAKNYWRHAERWCNACPSLY
ncbi:MAG: bifunctional riboflavin kinase/FAD synthetase [Bryobacteraceae bacterium]